MASERDRENKLLTRSMVNYLKDVLERGEVDETNREGIEVAIQCIQSAFNLTDHEPNDDVPRMETLLAQPNNVNEAIELKKKANAAYRSGNVSEAVAFYDKAISLYGQDATFFCNRAAMLSDLKRYTEAIADCKRAIDLDPNYAKAYNRLATAYQRTNQTEAANAALAKYNELTDRTRTGQGANQASTTASTESQVFTPAFPTINEAIQGVLTRLGQHGDSIDFRTLLGQVQAFQQRHPELGAEFENIATSLDLHRFLSPEQDDGNDN